MSSAPINGLHVRGGLQFAADLQSWRDRPNFAVGFSDAGQLASETVVRALEFLDVRKMHIIAPAHRLERARARFRDLPQENFHNLLHFSRSASARSKEFFKICNREGIGAVLLLNFWRRINIARDKRIYILNCHASLLPSFGGKGYYGKNLFSAILKSGATETGVTLHCVTSSYDRGPVLLQQRLAIYPRDDEEALRQRSMELQIESVSEWLRAYAPAHWRVPLSQSFTS